MKRAMTLVAACAVALSTPTLGQTVANCNQGCTVIVSVPAGCGSGIQVSLDPIRIRIGTERRAVIRWEIPRESTWNFASENGINFIAVGFDAAAFDGKRPAASGNKQVSVTNTPTKPGVYKYDINLTRGSGTTREDCTLDPTVINW